MAKRRARKRRNPGGSIMVLNPRRRRRKSSSRATGRRRRRNPSTLFHARKATRRRRRNPGFGGIARGAKIFGLPLKAAVGIAGGVLAVKAAGNLIGKFVPLPEGPIKKYGLQFASAVIVSMIGRKMLGKGIGDALATGGAVAIMLGVANDYVVPHVPLLADYDTWQPGAQGMQEYLPGLGDETQWLPSMG